MGNGIARRDFLLGLGAAGLSPMLAATGCGAPEDPSRYTEEDKARLAAQRERELTSAGRGPFGYQHYRGYAGLAELPWFEVDSDGVLRCVAADVNAIDMHCHLGMSVLFAPELDLHRRSERVQHLLDCDGEEPGCDLDLDIYINGNFSAAHQKRLRRETISQGFFGSAAAATHTIPNLLAEMDAMRVEQCAVLPIVFGFPFGDDLSERWRRAIAKAEVEHRLLCGASVHPRDSRKIEHLEAQAAAGARIVKLHPTMQRFYPDEQGAMEIYEACERLGLIVFWHGGRAGIEPEATQRYALPRHYEGALSGFPNVDFVIGHGGARDFDEMLEIGLRYENAWFDTHGQGVTKLYQLLRRSGGERMVFGTDWPFYHVAASLAKVLLITEQTPDLRDAVLRENALKLLARAAA